MSLTALLTHRAEFGREADAKGRTEAWVAEKLADFRNPGLPSEHYVNGGRVIRKSEYRTRNGGTVGVRYYSVETGRSGVARTERRT